MKKFPLNLCHPDDEKSCAACCGLYNFKHNSRNHTIERLRRNTQVFRQKSKINISEIIKNHTSLYRPKDNGPAKCFQRIFNCEFVGFVDSSEKKVGCLLHPSLNSGRDLRGYSFYGDRLCEEHYCLSYFYLSPNEQLLVTRVIKDWYLYGLTITDIDLVKATYQTLSDKVGEAINVGFVYHNKKLSALVLEFFKLKLNWPFRIHGKNRFGKYIFHGDEYREININYKRLHRKKSPFHTFFKAYGSEFTSGVAIDEAEKILNGLVEGFCKIYCAERG